MDRTITLDNPQHNRGPRKQSQPALSDKHFAEIVEGSGVDPELVEGRYWTVTAEEARALGFSEKQARPGWVVELISPTGEVGYQLKPDTPRLDEDGKPVKYETPAGRKNIISTHPRMRQRLVEGNEPFYAVEGAKKCDCVASRGRVAVMLTGVWNGVKKPKKNGVKRGRPELLPDWDLVPLEGRKVYICFDADFREKRGVALAMVRLAERLTERGAHVYIIWLPDLEKGVDDYVVAGGSLERLEEEATPYQGCDLTPYVAKDSRVIRQVVAAMEQRMAQDSWSRMSGKTDHSLLRAILELALERGREDDTGAVEVLAPMWELQQRAEIGSRQTLAKSIARIEERDYITKVPGDAYKGEANRYILNPTRAYPLIGETGIEPSILHTPSTPLSGYAPHLRWPAPPPPEDARAGYGGSKLPHLGKTRELILHLLCSWGGSATMRDLAEAAGVGDTTHLRNRYLEELAELGVVELPEKGTRGDKAIVSLNEEWRRRLDGRREMGGELSASRRQAAKFRRDRDGFYSPHKPGEEPPPMSREKWERVLQERREEEEKARLEEQRRKVGVTAETFVYDRLKVLGRVRLELLKEVYHEAGGRPYDIPPAAHRLGCKIRKLPEFKNQQFVFPPTGWEAA